MRDKESESLSRKPIQRSYAVNTSNVKMCDSVVKWLEKVCPPGIVVGTICAIFASAIFPFAMVTAALLPLYSPLTVITIGGLWTYCFSMTVLTIMPDNSDLIVKDEVAFTFLRGLFLAGTAMTSFAAIVYIPTGDVFALRFSNSVFVSIAGYFILKENFGKIQGFCALGVVIGVFFVTQPSFIFGKSSETGTKSDEAWIGILLAIASCAFQTGEVIALRLTPKTSTFLKMASSNLLVGICGALYVAAFSNNNYPKCGFEFALAMAGACSILIAYFLFDYSSKMLKAGYNALLRTASVFFSYCYQIFILGQTPSWMTIFGALIICVFVILPTLTKRLPKS